MRRGGDVMRRALPVGEVGGLACAEAAGFGGHVNGHEDDVGVRNVAVDVGAKGPGGSLCSKRRQLTPPRDARARSTLLPQNLKQPPHPQKKKLAHLSPFRADKLPATNP